MEIQKKHAGGNIILFTTVLAFGYAVVRYHLAGDVPWKDFPLYIINKGLSFAALILLAFNFTMAPLKNMGVHVPDMLLNSRAVLGMTGFLFVLIHLLISMLIFKPEFYAKFFEEDGSVTLYAGMSMLGGILAFAGLYVLNFAFKTNLKESKVFMKFITSRRFLLIAMLFTLIHIFFMGFEGWLKPSGWYGGMPPISLVSFGCFFVGYAINLFGRK